MSDSPKIPLVDLQAQSRSIREEVIAGITEVVDSCAFILGPQVTEFEKQFAEYCGAKHCIGLANGTEALHMALRALDIGPCLLYTSPSPRDRQKSRMPSSA